MRNNALARKIELNQTTERVSDDQQVARLRRKEARLTSELQQLTNNLNVLVSENGKLKAQVDVSRNSRVIYSNVYKTIEKEIRKHEYLYKLAIIDCLSYEEVHKRAADRLQKTSRRIEKDISELQGSAKPLRKKDKRKSRLDTGLSSYRVHLSSFSSRAKIPADAPMRKQKLLAKTKLAILLYAKLHFQSETPLSAPQTSALSRQVGKKKQDTRMRRQFGVGDTC